MPSKARLNQTAPAEGTGTESIRNAGKEAIRKREFAHMRDAHLKQPDRAAEADDWSNAEEYRA
jgi:hypothetical protein